MKPPKTVTVGPYTYTLEASPDVLDDGKYGDTSERLARIRYHADQHPLMLRSVIVHELLHACALAAGISLTDKLDQETFIRRVEPFLLSTLRSNGEMIAWLQA